MSQLKSFPCDEVDWLGADGENGDGGSVAGTSQRHAYEWKELKGQSRGEDDRKYITFISLGLNRRRDNRGNGQRSDQRRGTSPS